jgi:hypothetical protein
VTITNNGAVDVNITTLGITGDFAIANDLCSGTAILPGGTCTFAVNFTPLTVGAKTGTLTITSDAYNSPDTLAISGTSYVISRTLRFRSNGTNDGTVRESSENSGLANFTESTNELINVGDDALKRQFMGILDFDTSSLPNNAVITGARLQVKGMILSANVYNKLGSLIADITNPWFGTSARLENIDFRTRARATNVGIFSRTTTFYRWMALNVNPASLFAVNKTGRTQFRIRFTLDDSNDTIKHELRFLSGNFWNPADRPMLIITYYIP